ncbi:hypothetical protein EG328_011407 [Venturia inaequalis]|uniref:Uncharacterized protein n=1 Tax=Venturia inaequalis TaxID=5025 RepID=A0A8H3V7I6_VENIN|nr:hypothetical protein EG328_011407 [Venturia inaequalis]
MNENVVDLTTPSPVRKPPKRPMSVSELIDDGSTNSRNERLEQDFAMNHYDDQQFMHLPYSPRKSQTAKKEGASTDDLFEKAMNSADIKVLRNIFRSLYAQSESFKSELQHQFLVPEEVSEAEPPTKKQKSSSDQQPFFTGPRYRTCLQCKEQFDTTQNLPDSCWRHSAAVEADEDAFLDDDDGGPQEPYEDDFRFEDLPEFFTWPCCEGNGDASACRVGPHNATHIEEGRSVESKLDSEEERDNGEDDGECVSQSGASSSCPGSKLVIQV